MNVDKKLVLTAIGIVGFGATIFVAVKNTKKVQALQDKDRRMKVAVEGTGAAQDISKIEWVKKYGKYYIPTLVMYTASAVCVISAYKMSVTEIAALSGALATAYSKRDKIETEIRKCVGDEAVDKAMDAVIGQEANELKDSDIYDTGNGKVLCCEGYFGTYFYSSEEAVEQAQKTIQEWIDKKYPISMEEYYKELGIKKSAQALGHFGWPPTQDGEEAYIPEFINRYITDENKGNREVYLCKFKSSVDSPIQDYWVYY